MKCWQMHEIGGDPATVLQLDEIDEPAIGPGQVRIGVEAVGITFPDLLMAQGKYQVAVEPPFSPGSEAAGTVLEVAADVTAVAVGDRVVATKGAGLAEQAVVAADAVFPIPESFSAAQATALVVNYGTTHYALHERAHIQAGETMLVTAAAGGVGSAAVQLGRAAGARVIGVAGGPHKVDFLRQLGADVAIDYLATPNFVDEVREASGGGVDVCYEVVGGDTFHHARRCMAWGGRLLIIGFTSGTIADAPTNHALLKSYSIVGVHWGASLMRDPESLGRTQAALRELADAGQIDPPLNEPVPFERAPDAFADLANRRTMGKVVVTTPARI